MSNQEQSFEQQLAQFKQLQAESKAVAESIIRFNTQVENNQENYKKVIEVADKKFETHNVDELEAKEKAWIAENTSRLTNWSNAVKTKKQELQEKEQLLKTIQQN